MTPTNRAMPAVRRVRRVTHLKRYRDIVGVLVSYGFVDVVHAMHLTSPFEAGRRLLFTATQPVDPDLTRPERLRRACEALGPTFIKLGQALSTRGDVLPPEIVAELSRLQDAVPPLDPGVAERAIEEEFGRPIDGLFGSFSGTPLAAASIAQVHRATLLSGEVVAVKVRRPGIEAVIEADLAILADLAALFERYIPDAALYSLSDLVAEFARSIRRELDLAREGRILMRIAADFAGDSTVRYPAVHWPLTGPSVLTMEFLDGVKVSAVGTPATPALHADVVARRGADVVLKQILVHGLFHADPHPGNILVLADDVVAFVDFGIVGRVDRRMRETLADTILTVGQRDGERLAEIVAGVAVPLRPVDLPELSRDLDEMLDAYADVPLGELSLAAVFAEIVATMSRHRLKLPADILLLIKAVSTIEAVGRQLDPSFKVVDHALPLVRAVVARRHAPDALVRRAASAGREALHALQEVPRDLAEITRRARADGLQIQFVHRNLDHFIHEMDRSSNRLSFAIVIAAVVVGSAVVMQAGVGGERFGYPSLGLAGFLVAAVLGIGLAIGILRSGKL
jgi:ubiquinone biosynthesis protein